MVHWKVYHLSKHDVFKGLGNAVPEAADEDMGTPPADSTAFPAMTNIKHTQLSSAVDDTISLLPRYKSEAKDKNTRTPRVDLTTPPAMTEAEDTQPSPVETLPADDTMVPAAKPSTKIQKDLPAAWGASPAKLEDPVAPTTIPVDKLASPPTPASHTIKERQEYLWLVKVHSSQKTAAVGSAPDKHREPGQHLSSKQCKGT